MKINIRKVWLRQGSLNKLKFANQQKTKTQDKLGELTTKNDIASYLKKEPKDIFANALANFWFKDADKFIQQKKSMYVQLEFYKF